MDHLVAAELDCQEAGGGDQQLAELPAPVLVAHHNVLQSADTATTVDELPLQDQRGGPHHLAQGTVLQHQDVVGGATVPHLDPPGLPLLPGDVPHRGQLGEQGQVTAIIVLQAEGPQHEARP